jgi:hypothetical protein
VRLRIRRLGGIAGVTLHAQVDTHELPEEQAAGVKGAIRDLAGHPRPAPPRPDGFRYEITPLEDQGPAEPILLDEREVPPQLKVLTEAVAKSGEIEHRDSSSN